jgi:integrase/recombinase XerD
MFETLYSYPQVLRRHREGPWAEERERFLAHCVEQGFACATLRQIAAELLVVARYFRVGEARFSTQDVEAAADQWVRFQRRRKRIHDCRWSRQRFISTASSWLRFLDCLEHSHQEAKPFAYLIDEFSAFMRDELGLSARTIAGRCWQARHLLDSLEAAKRSLARLSLKEVDDYLAMKADHGWGRVSMASAASALRSFFKYAEMRRWCPAGIAAGIEGPRVFRDEGLPRGLDWQWVRQLIASTSGCSARDIRDRAILMLFAIYGLRRGEVSQLRLEDVDWEHEVLRVHRPKQRRTQDYPLVSVVGDAILRYLQEVRPRSARRELFLALKAPFRPLSTNDMYRLVRSRLAALGVSGPHCGPHCLRHACATHLLASGFTLKQIGDHLGHRSAYATRVYAKVDLAGLRQVAEFDLRGLL